MDDRIKKASKLAHRALAELDAARDVLESVQALPRVRALRAIGAALLLHGFDDVARHCAEAAEELNAAGEKEENGD